MRGGLIQWPCLRQWSCWVWRLASDPLARLACSRLFSRLSTQVGVPTQIARTAFTMSSNEGRPCVRGEGMGRASSSLVRAALVFSGRAAFGALSRHVPNSSTSMVFCSVIIFPHAHCVHVEVLLAALAVPFLLVNLPGPKLALLLLASPFHRHEFFLFWSSLFRFS